MGKYVHFVMKDVVIAWIETGIWCVKSVES
jgi:hypothetical protein